MRKLLYMILLLLQCGVMFGQKYDSSNSMSRIGIVYYVQDENGFFHKKENVNLAIVADPISTYAYDKKSQELYLITNNANCVVRLTDNLAKLFKKSKSIPILSGDELEYMITAKNKELDDQYLRINNARQNFITDSIAKAKRDSIDKVVKDSLQKIADKEKETAYRAQHKWFLVPTNKTKLYCVLCEKEIATKEETFCYTIKNDTIYWPEPMSGKLDIQYDEIHVANIPDKLRNEKDYSYHVKMYADSLANKFPFMSSLAAAEFNVLNYNDYLDELKKEAPNGLVLDWSWNSEYSNVSLKLKYMNTNKKTIKYLDVFFSITNDVGDVRKSGKVSGTGPVEEFYSSSWDWDRTGYYVSGDATKMSLTKLIVTYMDGTKVTIPKNKIRIN